MRKLLAKATTITGDIYTSLHEVKRFEVWHNSLGLNVKKYYSLAKARSKFLDLKGFKNAGAFNCIQSPAQAIYKLAQAYGVQETAIAFAGREGHRNHGPVSYMQVSRVQHVALLRASYLRGYLAGKKA